MGLLLLHHVLERDRHRLQLLQVVKALEEELLLLLLLHLLFHLLLLNELSVALLHLALAKAGLDTGLGCLTLLMGRVNALALLLVLALLLRLHLCQKQALLLLLTQELELCERGVPCE